MGNDGPMSDPQKPAPWFIYFAVGVLLTCVVLLLVLGFMAEATVPFKEKRGFDGPAVAVAVVDAQMELTRRQVLFYDVDGAKAACAEAAWRPQMHHALKVLETDPLLTVMAERWRVAWTSALVSCYRGDMAKANGFIDEAYQMRDSLWMATTYGDGS